MPSRPLIRKSDERGIAMITTLLVLMLMSALLVGFTTVVMSDQRYRFIDRDRGQAFYAASAGVEKLTADIGNLFLEYVAPTATQVQNLTATPPSISGITFVAPQAPGALPASQLTTYHCNGRDPVTNALLNPPTKAPVTVPVPGAGNGYTITFCKSIATGNPTVSDDNLVISGTGAYAGMTALQSPYQIDVTAKTAAGGEVHLVRTMQSVAIPVFQFGIFSDSDLSFFAAEDFGFGGRIHTNGNLWLAEGSGNTLTTTGKITAVGDVVRTYMSNGIATSLFMAGTVNLATSLLSPTGNLAMAMNQGSVAGLPGSTATSNWSTISKGGAYYNGFIKNSATGATRLSLPLTATGVGGTNVDLIRRPCITGAPLPCTGTAEDVNSILYNERLFTKASLRILLSDKDTDITNIPGVTATPPVQLDGDWRTTPPTNGTATLYNGGVVDAAHPPIARSIGQNGTLTTTNAATVAGAGTISVVANSVPAMFLKPQLTAKDALTGLLRVGPFTCTTWTDTQFQGCTLAAAIPLGYIIYVSNPAGTATMGSGNMPGNGVPSVTVAAAVTAGSGKTITLNAGQTTWKFAANTFFINDVGSTGTGVSTPVTCSGATVSSFTGCTGVPVTKSGATITTSYVTPLNTGTIGGWIKIEKSSNTAPPVWTDVTMEILSYGIGSNDPLCNPLATNTAIVQLQRPRNNNALTCSIGDKTNSYEWWPNAMFDTREGTLRDADPGTNTGGTLANNGLPLLGVMYYIGIDAKNLARWFKASGAPFNAGTGANSRTDTSPTGYTVYFSDRRNNRDANSKETGEFGYEDFVNPGVATGLPNGACNLPAEDVNGNGTCETYGQFPSNGAGAYNTVVGGTTQVSPLIAAGTPTNVRPTTLVKRGIAQVNRPVFFRRALKIFNGSTLGSDATVANRITGLTVVSENPVYVQGDWNATSAADFAVGSVSLHAATAVIADAVTLLSNVWDDDNGFAWPYGYGAGGRLRTAQSYYRVAILGGKGVNFPLPSDVTLSPVFGTDGGPHNFLRMVEQDGSAAATNTVNYRGSMASLYYNRQGIGTFKCCSGNATDGIVYSVPIRNFQFDLDFLQPALLPPNTPMFRDLNVIGFSQELRPGK